MRIEDKLNAADLAIWAETCADWILARRAFRELDGDATHSEMVSLFLQASDREKPTMTLAAYCFAVGMARGRRLYALERVEAALEPFEGDDSDDVAPIIEMLHPRNPANREGDEPE